LVESTVAIESKGLDEVGALMVYHPWRNILKDESSEGRCGVLPATTRCTAGGRDIEAGWVKKMSPRVARSKAIWTARDTEHSISDSVVKD
jgi:hypothetical protein